MKRICTYGGMPTETAHMLDHERVKFAESLD
jgi:hypothetical protein